MKYRAVWYVRVARRESHAYEAVDRVGYGGSLLGAEERLVKVHGGTLRLLFVTLAGGAVRR
jgi:hypothetical protein